MNAAIIVAAGTGSRMKSATPKQFLPLDNEMVLTKTVRVFEQSPEIQEIILVVAPDWADFVRTEIVQKENFKKVKKIVHGGAERYDSVYAGLLACPEADNVFIHDGARPYVTETIIRRCADAVEEYQAIAVGMPVKDTIKIADENGYAASTPDRRYVWTIQTPQVFSYAIIRAAYELIRDTDMKGITDDAMVVEASKIAKVKLIEGSYANIKITTPDDLRI